MKNTAILALSAVLGFGAAFAAVSHVAPSSTAVAQPMWAQHFKTVTGLVAGVDVIAVVEHVTRAPGREVGGLSFTNHGFLVHEVLKGVHHGAELIVEQTGGAALDGTLLSIGDGGPYEPGQRYVLFLNAREDGTYYLVNPQGRYEITGDGICFGVGHDARHGDDAGDPVVARLSGLHLDTVVEIVRERASLLE